MRMNYTILISAFFVTISLFISIPLISSQKIENAVDFSYEAGAENGPEHWGEINANWTKCGTGHLQSPIDLLNNRVRVDSYLGRLLRSYRPANATMKNIGHSIQLKWQEDAGSILINGKHYHLIQLHWHSPSEHTINGRRYAMEMHMVHQTTDGNSTAVIGFLYKYGSPDCFLTEVEPYIKKVANKTHEEETAVGVFDPRKIKLGSRKYYRYIGSLTTPPCTEGVVWTIVKKVSTSNGKHVESICKIWTVSKEQVDMLKGAVREDSHDNARPVQSIYDRMIDMYRPMKANY